MNTRELDFAELAGEVLSCGENPPAALADTVGRLLFAYPAYDGAEDGTVLILGCPNALLDRAPEALRLFRNNPNRVLIPTGGVPVPGESFTEAEMIRGFLLSRGVPKDRVTVENRATNTLENFTYGAEFVAAAGKQTLFVQTSSYHMRRSLLYEQALRSLFPGVTKVVACPSDAPFCRADNWMETERGRVRASKEIALIARHLADYPGAAFDF